jgi:hypothetical protein
VEVGFSDPCFPRRRRNLKDAAGGFLLGLLLGCLDMGIKERIQTPDSVRKCPAGYGEASQIVMGFRDPHCGDVKVYPTRWIGLVGHSTENLDIHR